MTITDTADKKIMADLEGDEVRVTTMRWVSGVWFSSVVVLTLAEFNALIEAVTPGGPAAF